VNRTFSYGLTIVQQSFNIVQLSFKIVLKRSTTI